MNIFFDGTLEESSERQVRETTPDVTGLAPDTIRLMRRHLHRIDKGFRQQSWHRQLFMQMLRQKKGVTFIMRLMNRYGVLAAYIPAFANIVGRMQYDLFHAYTVDEHTLVVLSNVRRYSTEKGANEMPFCSEVFKTLQKPELLYLAALFHDIAKGRQGDHSVLGAEDALNFAREHSLNLHDANLVSWMVRNHLLMSITAQRKDITDPDEILKFADQVGAQNRLDYLFLLTVADMKGTNPKLWNSWKLSLLTDLYQSTREALRKKTQYGEETERLLRQKRDSSLEVLTEMGFSQNDCLKLWDKLGEDYLLKHSVETICWQAQYLLTSSEQTLPIVEMRITVSNSSNVLFIYSEDFPGLFTRVVSTMEQLNLNIVQSRLVSVESADIDLHTLHVLGPDNKLITEERDQQHILEVLRRNLSSKNFTPTPHHRKPRILRNFDIPTKVTFRQQPEREVTLLELSAGDMPGLLGRIGKTLDQLDIKVHNAQISTLGEQAEDVFYITTRDEQMITDVDEQEMIRLALTEAIAS